VGDLAALAEASLAAYECTLQPRWLELCEALLLQVRTEHQSPGNPFLRMAPPRGEELFASRPELQDDVIASPNSTLARLFWRTGHLWGDAELVRSSRHMVQTLREAALSETGFHANWLRAFLQQARPALTIRLQGREATRWAREIWMLYPWAILGGQASEGETRAEICAEDRCLASPGDLRATLEGIGRLLST
jgi:uncharacterized protein YyaL (SSP411 family)